MTLRHATAVTAALATVLVACTACGHNTDSPAPPPTPSHRPSLDLSHAEGSPVPYDEAVKTFKALTEEFYQIHKNGTFDPKDPRGSKLSNYSSGRSLDNYIETLEKLNKGKVRWQSGTYKIISIHQVATPKDHPAGTTLETCEDWRSLRNRWGDGSYSHGDLVQHRSTYQYGPDGKARQIKWTGGEVKQCH